MGNQRELSNESVTVESEIAEAVAAKCVLSKDSLDVATKSSAQEKFPEVVPALQAIELQVGEDLTIPPVGSDYTEFNVPKKDGCVATASNIYQELLDGFDSTDFEINLDKMEETLATFGGRRLEENEQPEEGDIVIGRSTRIHRHMGVVRTADENGITVYHNHSGELSVDTLEDRFKNENDPKKNYDEVYFIRVPGLRACRE